MSAIISRKAAILPLLLMASPVLAECPSSLADTADGVHVTFSDFHVRFDRQADGTVIEEEVYFGDGGGFRVHSLNGAFVLSSSDMNYGAAVIGSSEVTEYADGVENLPLLGPGQGWSGSAVRSHDDGVVNVETIGVTVENPQTLSLGECNLQAWPMVVTTTNDVDGGVFIDHLTYLPSLGFAIYHGGAEAGESFTRDEPVGISTEPPVTNEAGALMPDIPVAAANNPAPAPAPGGEQPSK